MRGCGRLLSAHSCSSPPPGRGYNAELVSRDSSSADGTAGGWLGYLSRRKRGGQEVRGCGDEWMVKPHHDAGGRWGYIAGL